MFQHKFVIDTPRCFFSQLLGGSRVAWDSKRPQISCHQPHQFISVCYICITILLSICTMVCERLESTGLVEPPCSYLPCFKHPSHSSHYYHVKCTEQVTWPIGYTENLWNDVTIILKDSLETLVHFLMSVIISNFLFISFLTEVQN